MTARKVRALRPGKVKGINFLETLKRIKSRGQDVSTGEKAATTREDL